MRKIPEKHKTTVGASLLAKASGQATAMLNVAPPSRAGSLPQGVWVKSESWIRRCNCGSEPARESVGSGDCDIECSAAFASRLAPTRDLCWIREL
ncbi:hypothetical protein DMX04_09490 [Pseudomonas koreensis]|nr:hypothetical protein DMX04_09490 [Pseudomonas koreensis]